MMEARFFFRAERDDVKRACRNVEGSSSLGGSSVKRVLGKKPPKDEVPDINGSFSRETGPL